MVVGHPRFSSFWPVGLKANLEYDFLFLLEAYKLSHTEVMKMPCSRRHKAVKFREEIVRQQNTGGGGGSSVPGGVVASHSWYQAQQALGK